MATEQEMQEAIDQLDEAIVEVADDTVRWTLEESAEIYEAVAASARSRGEQLRREMGK